MDQHCGSWCSKGMVYPELVEAIYVYPMNALANDQLERLRLLGSAYVLGRTLMKDPESCAKQVSSLLKSRAYRKL